MTKGWVECPDCHIRFIGEEDANTLCPICFEKIKRETSMDCKNCGTVIPELSVSNGQMVYFCYNCEQSGTAFYDLKKRVLTAEPVESAIGLDHMTPEPQKTG